MPAVEAGLLVAMAASPGRRRHRTRRYPDLAFPEHLNPDVAPPGWRPVFYDYLYLGLTNAVAFSPTDVMPLAHWAKLTYPCFC